jgi:hypothetical protein
MKFPAWNSHFQGQDGEEYLCYLNPFHPFHLILADKENRYVATLERQMASSWSDVKGIEKQLGASTKELHERMRDIGIRNLPLAKKRVEATRNNTAVIDSALPKTAADRAREVIKAGASRNKQREEEKQEDDTCSAFMKEQAAAMQNVTQHE